MHSHESTDIGQRRLLLSVVANIVLSGVEFVGGALTGSLALMADALHNLSDAGALGLALFARHVARRPSDKKRTYGYRRAEIIGALLNVVILILISVYLAIESISRCFNPQGIDGEAVIWIASLALAVDLLTVALTHKPSKDSLNIRAAYLHHLADALASVAVILAGLCILLWNWVWMDLAITLLVSCFILHQSWGVLKQTIHILMEGVPGDLNLDEMVSSLSQIEGVKEIHHVHCWQMDEKMRSFEAHVVLDSASISVMETVKQALREKLAHQYHVEHSTLEFEFSKRNCA